MTLIAEEFSIQIKNLKFGYGDQPILNIPTFEVKKGEILFLQGPSGSGKSTLLELMAGVLKSQMGQLKICGYDLAEMETSDLDKFRSQHVGYIFQSFNLIPYLTVLQNIELPFLFNKQSRAKAEFTADLQSLLSSLGLEKFLQRKVSQLSVGQQQRVAVARALIKTPSIILADEPTSALDHEHRENFLKILFDLCRKNNTTVVFVSHDLSIEKYFDRSIRLNEINQVQNRTAELP
jgi:putative ABC transport system ATP-binding protein